MTPREHELDERVLREIFKADVEWREFESHDHTYSPAGFYGTFPDNPTWCYHPGGFDKKIQEAWTIVEKLQDKAFYVCVSTHFLDGFDCIIQKSGVDIRECGDTAPMAILNAALQAEIK